MFLSMYQNDIRHVIYDILHLRYTKMVMTINIFLFNLLKILFLAFQGP
jgi:hypothetical protein